jgi:hypothetical protein
MVNVLGGEDDDLHDRLIHVWAADPGAKVHLYGKQVRPGRKVGHVTVAGEDAAAPRPRHPRRELHQPRHRGAVMTTSGGPLVGVVMGSDSDWPVMSGAADVLTEFGVPFEADVVSAHRMPRQMMDYGSAAADRGSG